MADNVTANPGTGGSSFLSAELAFSGDTVKLPGSFLGILVGSEGAWTYTLLPGGAGAVTAGVPRVTLASDDPLVVAGQIIDDWDESDRCKSNIIVGQAGISAGAGAVAANTPRMTLASDDPAVASLALIAASASVLDDWDESDRAKVNLIAGVAGITAGAGAVAVGTPRVTLASDDPAVASLALISASASVLDDWDESDRAKVNLIAGVAGITAGAGAVAAGTPRVTLASDDPLVVSASVMDDWDESDRAKVNIIVGQAGVAAGAGAASSSTVRTISASDDGAVVALQIMDDWDNAASDGASVSGDVAHGATDAGEPVKQGAKATSSLSGVTLVTTGQRTDLYAGLDGVPIHRNHCNLEDIVSGNASDTGGSSTQVLAAAGLGIKQYLTRVTVTNTSSTNTYCELKSGTTVKHTVPVPANGGVTLSFDPPLPPNAANEAWNFDMGTAVTTAYCSMVGFKSKV